MFTKLFKDILYSSIWTENDQTRLVWITMLAMADKRGEVMASVPGLAIAAQVSREGAEMALKCLLSPDPDSRTEEHEGRRIEKVAGGWRLLNHAAYHQKMDQEERREYQRKKQAEYREKKKKSSIVNADVNGCKRTVTNAQSLHTETETETETENPRISISDKLKSHPRKSGDGSVSEKFEEFWNKVPHKIGKAAAQKAFAKAIKETDPAVILGGILDHEAHRLQQANPPSPIHPATFIRNARWEDEYGAPSSNGNGSEKKRDKDKLYNNPKNAIPPMPKQFIEYMADLKDFQGNPVELNEHQVKAKWNEKTWRESFRKETKHYGN